MFERFTDRARRVVVLAQEEARMLDHNYIGTEHLLLGLIAEGEGVANRALQALGVDGPRVRSEVEAIVGRGHGATAGHIPFTPRAKKVLEHALREALQLGHNYIGTEHILLGLLRGGDGVAAEVLQKLGLDLASVRQTVVQMLAGEAVEGVIAAGGEPGAVAMSEYESAQGGEHVSAIRPEDFPTCPACHASLVEWLRVRVIDARTDEDEVTPVRIAYCGRCGAALQVVP